MTKEHEKKQIRVGESQRMKSRKPHACRSGEQVETKAFSKLEDGKVGWILLWALGVPIPILLVLFVLRGCT